jgi:branched-chain amino acid transport system substrate-binding protein
MTRMSRRDFVWNAACLGSAALLGRMGLAVAQDAGVIKIGMTSALTGPYNEFGEGSKRGIDLAIEQWNAKGGINGRKIEISTLLDDQLVPDRAAQNMRRLLDDKSLVAFFGPAGSGPVMAVIDMVAADGRVFINPLAQNPAATYPNGMDKPPRPNVFQFGIPSNVEAEFLGKFMAKQYKSIGLVHENTAFGVAGRDTLSTVIKRERPDVKLEVESYAQRATDVTPQLLRLQRANVEVVLIVGLGTDLVNLRRTMGRIAMTQPLVTSAGGLSLPYLEGAGDSAIGTIAPLVGSLVEPNPRPEVTAYINAYKAKYGTDRYWGNDKERPQAQMSLIVVPPYDGANILFEGMRRANSTDTAKVIAAIETIKNYPGVNTVYNFSPARHHGITEESLTMLKVVKKGDKLGLEIYKG